MTIRDWKNSEADVEQTVTAFSGARSWLYKRKWCEQENQSGKEHSYRSRFETIIPDLAVYVDAQPFLMVKPKPINRTISQIDVNEAISNARSL